MASLKLSRRLSNLLACPICHSPIRSDGNELRCEACPRSFAMKDQVPIFLDGPAEIAPDQPVTALGSEYEALLKNSGDLVLNVGARSTAGLYPNCIELDQKLFRHTDVIGDPEHLPFRDAVFDRVFAFNLFEHLHEPHLAASEIHRVLKPGGSVAVHTAFLQALHEAPFHFFNATEFGVREWFKAFEIDECSVSGNFGPGVMLAFLLSNVMDAVGAGELSWKEQALLGESTIGEWAEFWRTRGEQPSGFQTLQNLPQAAQKKIAAGFELIARKPGASVP